MKKIWVIVLSFVLAFSAFFPMSVTAAFNTYDISGLMINVEATIPEGYDVITRDTPSSDPIFSKLGTTSSVVFDEFERYGIYLKAISSDNIVVTVSDRVLKHFDFLSDNSNISQLEEWYDDCGLQIVDFRFCHTSRLRFLEIYFTDYARSFSALQYYTVYNGRSVSFILYSNSARLDEQQENTLKAVVNNSIISNAPTATEPEEDTEAFQYTDSDAKVSFTVPANWKQAELSTDGEYLDTKFISTKEDGCGIIYGSVDMWEEIPADDRVGYTRSDLNNSAFTIVDIAEMYNTTFDKISKVTYNGVQYYIAEIHTSSDTHGVDIALTMTYLVHIDNGWMYIFQFSGTSSHKLYSDFEKLLNSVKYPAVSNAEATEPSNPAASVPDHSKQNFSQNTSENISQNSSNDSKNNSGVIAVVVLLVIVPAIVAAVVVTRKKNTETTNQSSYSTINNVPVTKPASDSEQTITCKKCDQTQPYMRNNNRPGGFLMKVLIWFLCISANAVVTTLIRECGFILGGIPTAVLFAATLWLAEALCKKWDEHKATKAERKKKTSGVRTGENGISMGSLIEETGSKNDLSATSGWQCSCGRVHPTYETACVCGKSKLDNKPEQPQSNEVAEVTNKIRFCRKCGEKLIDNSRFCAKCGTEIVVVKNMGEYEQNDVLRTETEEKARFCRKCGQKLSPENNSQCAFCGTVVKYHSEVDTPAPEAIRKNPRNKKQSQRKSRSRKLF